MGFAVMKPQEFVVAQRGRVVTYGRNGAGKSTFAATMPEAVEGKVLLISAKHERLLPYAAGVKAGRIVPAFVDDWDGVVDLLLQLRNTKPGTYGGVVFDTFTRLVYFGLEKLSGIRRSASDWEKYLKIVPAGPKDRWGMYGDLGWLAAELIRTADDLPLDICYVCQEDTYHPKFEQDILQTGPDIAGNATWKTMKDVVGVIGYLYVAGSDELSLDGQGRGINPNRQETRRLLLGQHDRYITKGPTHALGYTVEEPTWAKLATSWRE